MATKTAIILSSVHAICLPVTSSIIALCTAHQQWQRVAQRAQWSFVRRSMLECRQQQKWEQCNSDLYLVWLVLSSWSTPPHSSANMGAFSCPCIQPSLLLSAWCAGSVCCVTLRVCLLQPVSSVPLLWKVVYLCSLRAVVCSVMLIHCLCITQACPRMLCIPLVRILSNENLCTLLEAFTIC